ncbi:DinB family protein [Flavobacterium sp.]|uniref:DinB family protein n=1 Tax=Flavobacterium sp. TaxID=239 RepID=UPI0039E29D0B
MDFKNQYELIRSSRGALLDYCETLSQAHLLEENSTFGRGSIRNLLVHNGYTYQYWLGVQALGKHIPFPEYESVETVADARRLFDQVDAIVSEFISEFESKPLESIQVTLREHTFPATALELFTHAISHEFHHKGQMLSLSRHLGYIPADTDVIR